MSFFGLFKEVFRKHNHTSDKFIIVNDITLF